MALKVKSTQYPKAPDRGFLFLLVFGQKTTVIYLLITNKDAMSFMVGTISQDYLLLLKDVEPFEIGKGPYANYLTVDETGYFEDILFSEAHIHHYSKENIHAVFTGDFFAWENIKQISPSST